MIKFFYGADKTYIDVTHDVIRSCVYGGDVYIPAGDTAAQIFADPLPGIVKGIFVIRESAQGLIGHYYGPCEKIHIALTSEEKTALDADSDRRAPGKAIILPPAELGNDEKLALIHSQLKFVGGDLREEWVEQFNTLDFIGPAARVLELGSGQGRNTLLISCVLADESNLVTLECNPATVEILRTNRSLNNFSFHIEAAALSYRKLMYNRDLALTKPSDELEEGYEWVNTITFEEIQEKYAIVFDTLVADCEGSLYYILQDNDSILKDIKTICLESDYRVPGQKWVVEDIFKHYGFKKVKWWILAGGDASGLPQECIDSFWEVWQK